MILKSFVKDFRANWDLQNREIINGPLGWLPEADWGPLKRKVYRLEVAIKVQDRNQLYVDAYLIMFTRADRVVVYAMTERENHVEFRDQAEAILKTLDLGPSEPGLTPAQGGPITSPSPAAQPAPDPAATPPADASKPASRPGSSPRPTPRRIGPPPSPE